MTLSGYSRVCVMVARVALAAVMVMAGIGKLVHEGGSDIVVVLQIEGVVTRWLAHAMERAAPLVEVVISVGMLAERLVGVSCVAGIILTSGFLYVAVAVPQGVECNCFGMWGGFSSRQAHITVATAMLVAFAFVMIGRSDFINMP